MKLSEVTYIPQMAGLYKIVGDNKNGVIAESIVDGKRTAVTNQQPISNLASITVYTTEGALSLQEVFKRMNSQGIPADVQASDEALRIYFQTIVPDYDTDKVHIPVIKKIITWYNELKDRIDFSN